MILNLNMIDDLKRQGFTYDLAVLGQRLGCCVRSTNARTHAGIAQLKDQLTGQLAIVRPRQLDYPAAVREKIDAVAAALVADFNLPQNFARWLVIQDFNQNQAVRDYVHARGLIPLVEAEKAADAAKFEDQIFQTRLTLIEGVLKAARRSLSGGPHEGMTAAIDRVVTNPILGLPIFVLVFFLIFKLSFDWVGTPLSDQLDALISGPVSRALNRLLISAGALPPLRSLVVNGLLAGVGGVLVFIPQIFVLFACISLLEDSGYMARAALVTDRLMQLIGLNGKSFIPLIIGFGCNVTGIMAARTIEQPRERLVTTLITPFMSCSARLPIYSLVVAALFPNHQAAVVLSVYFLGIVVALAVAKGYQLFFGVRERSVFVVELPQYHRPRLDVIWQGTWEKGKGFIKKAGTVIFAGTVLIWLLSSFGPAGFVADPTRSFAALLGSALVPVLTPIGIHQWQAISALLTGVLAKEVITASMLVMFHTSNQAHLIAALSGYFTPVAAYAFLVFILLYTPCFATLGTIKQETGSTKWALWSLFSSFAIAYLLSFLIYQVGSFFIH